MINIKDSIKINDIDSDINYKKFMNYNTKCRFRKICKYCTKIYSIKCCLRKTLANDEFKICKSLKICPNYFLCKSAVNEKISRLSLFYNPIPTIKELSSISYQVKNSFNNLDVAFIPRVEVSEPKQMEIIKRLKLPAITVSLNGMISKDQNRILKKGYEKDLHKTLKFEGKIILLTNIHDYHCIKVMNNIEDYITSIYQLNPDAITTFDANFYTNQPLFTTAIISKSVLESNEKLKNIDIPQIGLLPPAPRPYFKILLNVLINANYQIIGIPLAEMNSSKDKYRFKITRHLQESKLNHKKFKVFYLSTSPRIKLRADHYSSNSWAKVKNSKTLNKQNEREKRLKRLISRAERLQKQTQLLEIGED